MQTNDASKNWFFDVLRIPTHVVHHDKRKRSYHSEYNNESYLEKILRCAQDDRNFAKKTGATLRMVGTTLRWLELHLGDSSGQ